MSEGVARRRESVHPTGFILHPAASLHDPGWGHPEHQGRLRSLASAVSKDMLALHDRVVQVEARSATEEEVGRVHDAEYLNRLREAVDSALEEDGVRAFDSADTFVSGASWDAALGSSGAVLAALDAVTKGLVRNAFVATRPPGHHAGPGTAMGFCLVNHVAVGARYVLHRGLGERVLIVDWDVHHGNGTQEVFYNEGNVFYLSLHQAGHFPGTGHPHETGAGDGLGSTLNVPLAPGTSRGDYLEQFSRSLEEVRSRFSPDWVLVSCGFDVLVGDPLGGQELLASDLYHLTAQVMALLADEKGRGPVVVLEGGYDPESIGTGTVAVLRALAGLESPE